MSSEKYHHREAVRVKTRDGDAVACPHCGKALADKDVYKDAKGWEFCRACFRKGRGAIQIPPAKSASFLFELEVEPDPGEFEVEKLAQLVGRPSPTAGYPWQNTRNYNAITPQEANLKRTSGMFPGDGQLPDVSPYFLLPAAGAGLGALTAEHSRTRGALRGLLTGSGAALGHAAGSALSHGDAGARYGGAAAGGVLAYLLARSLLPEQR